MGNKKVAIVTGGGKGIGLAIAHKLSADGWQVVIADRDEKVLSAAVAEVGGDTLPLLLDVSKVSEIKAGVASIVAQTGRLDGLVNNAGLFKLENMLDTQEADFDRLVSVNVKGVYFMMQAFGQAIADLNAETPREEWGVIINIASAAGRSGRITQAVYGMTKAAVIHMTKSAAFALAEHKIRTSCLCPAAIDTEMMQDNIAQRKAVGGDADVAAFFARIPLGRMGTAEECADLTAYLMSEKAAFITGGSIDISGGLDMQ